MPLLSSPFWPWLLQHRRGGGCVRQRLGRRAVLATLRGRGFDDHVDKRADPMLEHAMRAANNVVIDVGVTGYALSYQAAVRVVNAIAGRNPL